MMYFPQTNSQESVSCQRPKMKEKCVAAAAAAAAAAVVGKGEREGELLVREGVSQILLACVSFFSKKKVKNTYTYI